MSGKTGLGHPQEGLEGHGELLCAVMLHQTSKREGERDCGVSVDSESKTDRQWGNKHFRARSLMVFVIDKKCITRAFTKTFNFNLFLYLKLFSSYYIANTLWNNNNNHNGEVNECHTFEPVCPKNSCRIYPVHRLWTGISPGSVLCGDQGLCRILALDFSQKFG